MSPAPWMARRAGTTHDVVIVGAGQAGLAIGFALQREGIDRVVLLDARPAGQEGPWRDVARMETLRSPKDLVGPEQGIAELTGEGAEGGVGDEGDGHQSCANGRVTAAPSSTVR